MDYEKITFEQLPEAMVHLLNEVASIKSLLTERTEPQPDPDRWLSITELCEYLPSKPTKATVYDWIHNKRIPHHKQGRKALSFRKSEIDEWLNRGRVRTIAEISSDACDYLCKKGKR